MKRFVFIVTIIIGFSLVLTAQEHRRYALMWHDEFDSNVLDQSVWSKPWRSHSNWAIHQSGHDSLYSFEDGDLVLWGKVNDFYPKDTAAFLTGGVWTRNRKAFGYGRVEVRAKFDVAQGFWPAIWMLPQSNQYINWPHGGEIDIMEHFRDNAFINHTIHTHYTYNLRKRHKPLYVAYPTYLEGEYNIYGVERFYDSLVFSVNGRRTFCYPRYRKGVDRQFPFSNYDYYLILDAQLGCDGSPSIDVSKLPVALRIDYVRYYELDTKTDVIPEPKEYQQLGTKKKKLRRVAYDKKTILDNPDEYRLVVKCGKATISGNRQWAESTLAQLTDENRCIANLEVHDWSTCPYRGIALDAKSCRLSFDELLKLIDIMAFYKLNYLLWDGKGVYSAEEVNMLRENARNLGIIMVDEITRIPNVELFNMENRQTCAIDRVFSKTADGKGGFLYLNTFGVEEMEALMAFAERYWRGGNAGEEEGGTLSPAGSRLTNFKEKVDIHKQRFHSKKR